MPAGEFVLGQPEAEVKVALDAFELGKYPVTYEQFAYFVENSGYPCDPVAINVESNRRGYSAVYVSWYDAVALLQVGQPALPVRPFACPPTQNTK